MKASGSASTAVMARRHRIDGGAPLLEHAIPRGHTSVMSARAPAPDDLDYFPTPPWAARAGGELITRIDPPARTCWEPACGGGHMAHGLRDYFASVIESDVHAHHGGAPAFVADFLDADARAAGPRVDWIVTNPPFVLGDAFVRAAFQHAERGVAMLLRLVFLEGGKRYHLLHEDCPLAAVAPFSERVPMVRGRWDPDASSATAYAWFIWRKGDSAPAPSLIAIPPGTRSRLSRPEDAERFNGAIDTPLLAAVSSQGREAA